MIICLKASSRLVAVVLFSVSLDSYDRLFWNWPPAAFILSLHFPWSMGGIMACCRIGWKPGKLPGCLIIPQPSERNGKLLKFYASDWLSLKKSRKVKYRTYSLTSIAYILFAFLFFVCFNYFFYLFFILIFCHTTN